MNHYDLDDKIWKDGTIGEIPLTEDEKARLLQMTLAKAGLKEDNSMRDSEQLQESSAGYNARKKLPKKKVWAFSIACVFILAMASVSIASIAMDKSFLDFFQPQKQEQVDTLNQANAALTAEATDNGLTVKMRQVIGDAHNMYVMFDVIAPEGMVLDKDQYLFVSPFVTVDGANSLGYHFEMLDEDPTDNQISMILVLNAREELVGKTANLNLTDFATYKPYDPEAENQTGGEQESGQEEAYVLQGEGGEAPPTTNVDDVYDVLVKGQWKLSFKLNYENLSQTTVLNEKIDLFGGECTMKTLDISPIAVTLVIEGDSIKKHGEQPPAMDGSEDFFDKLVVTLKDGTVVDISSGGSSMDGKKMVLNYQLGNIISPEDVASITFLGKELLNK